MIEIKQIEASETHFLRHKVMWSDKPLAFVILEEDEKGKHFGLFEDSRLISVISVFLIAWLRKFTSPVSLNFCISSFAAAIVRRASLSDAFASSNRNLNGFSCPLP